MNERLARMAQLFTISKSITIQAPIERCFLLSTHLSIVQDELGMRPVPTSKGSRIQGFVTEGDTIRWRGWKFGLPQFHESLIEAFDPPRFFRDRMIGGRFKTFEHDHIFEDLEDNTTRLTDNLRFTMPLGRIGELVGAVFLTPHIHHLMRSRFLRIKRIAEGEDWQQYLQPEGA